MEQDQIEQGARLQKLIKALNLNQSSFAKSLGMTQPNISRMVNGETKLSWEVLNGISRVHKQVNLHWLLTGYGEMLLAATAENETPKSEMTIEERMERLEEMVRRLIENPKD